MSDTVKLIIEIPKYYYESIKHDVEHHLTEYLPFKIIGNGIPLDDVKLKIEQDMCFDMFNDYGNETAIHKELWEILDNIGKAEMRGDKAE